MVPQSPSFFSVKERVGQGLVRLSSREVKGKRDRFRLRQSAISLRILILVVLMAVEFSIFELLLPMFLCYTFFVLISLLFLVFSSGLFCSLFGLLSLFPYLLRGVMVYCRRRRRKRMDDRRRRRVWRSGKNGNRIGPDYMRMVVIGPGSAHLQCDKVPETNRQCSRKADRRPPNAAGRIIVHAPCYIEVDLYGRIVSVFVFCSVPMCGSPGGRIAVRRASQGQTTCIDMRRQCECKRNPTRKKTFYSTFEPCHTFSLFIF